uniref:Uncharacterized protein n=1 Tax=Anguilla anguilla TaxID=7936 RepID=A0A0E9W000_ANGAN
MELPKRISPREKRGCTKLKIAYREQPPCH